MNFIIQTAVSPFRPTATSQCDMIDAKGPCCSGHLALKPGERVCEVSSKNEGAFQTSGGHNIDITVVPGQQSSILTVNWAPTQAGCEAVQKLYNLPSQAKIMPIQRQEHGGLSIARRVLGNETTVNLTKRISVLVDGIWLHHNKITWGWAVKWKTCRWGWHVSLHAPQQGGSYQLEEFCKNPNHIRNDAIAHFSQVLGIPADKIADVEFPPGGRGDEEASFVPYEGTTVPVNYGQRHRVVWRKYRFSVILK